MLYKINSAMKYQLNTTGYMVNKLHCPPSSVVYVVCTMQRSTTFLQALSIKGHDDSIETATS